jgi:hypothetical protein
MGNHLSGLAHAKGLQWELDEQLLHVQQLQQPPPYYNNNNNNKPQLILRHQTNTNKWQSARSVLQQCFPNLTPLDFEEANTPEFPAARAAQKKWLQDDFLLTLPSSNTTTTRTMSSYFSYDDLTYQLDAINGRQYGSYRVVDSQQMEVGLNTFQSLYMSFWQQQQQQQQQDPENNNNINNNATSSRPTSTSTTSFSIPFLLSHTLASNYMVNRHYDKIVDFLKFNETACCGPETPYPDETVFVSTKLMLTTCCYIFQYCMYCCLEILSLCFVLFPGSHTQQIIIYLSFFLSQHFRNFGGELGSGRANTIGYSELPPRATARELLGHLQAGDRVAITTRRRHNKKDAGILEKYVTAMTNRGLQVRVIEGQSGAQDFCFLMRARKGLVGNAASTYVSWAAILGHAESVQLYIYDTPGLRNAVYGEGKERSSSDRELQDILGYQWDHPKLKDRIKFPVYNTTTNTPATATH